MTVEKLIALLQTMPPGWVVTAKDADYDKYYRVSDVLVFGYDDYGEQVRSDDPLCVSRDVTIMLRDV